MRLYADYLNQEYGALDSDYVFVNLWSAPVGRPWSYSAVYDLVERLRTRTGIEFGPHLFRHTYATWLLRRGAGMESVKGLLGHASIATTIDTYGHLTVEDARTTLAAAGWFTGREVTGDRGTTPASGSGWAARKADRRCATGVPGRGSRRSRRSGARLQGVRGRRLRRPRARARNLHRALPALAARRPTGPRRLHCHDRPDQTRATAAAPLHGRRLSFRRSGRGLCARHRDRWERSGRPDPVVWAAQAPVVAPAEPRECRLTFCTVWPENDRTVFCKSHTNRWRKPGRPDIVEFVALSDEVPPESHRLPLAASPAETGTPVRDPVSPR